MEHKFPAPTIHASNDPDYQVVGIPKRVQTQEGEMVGADTVAFGYFLDEKKDHKTATLVMIDGDNKLFAPLTVISARRIGEQLIKYAELNEEGALEQLRALLSKPRKEG